MKVIEMEDKINVIAEEKQRSIVNLQNQLKNEKSKTEQLEEKLTMLERKYECYEDQLLNMQVGF